MPGNIGCSDSSASSVAVGFVGLLALGGEKSSPVVILGDRGFCSEGVGVARVAMALWPLWPFAGSGSGLGSATASRDMGVKSTASSRT